MDRGLVVGQTHHYDRRYYQTVNWASQYRSADIRADSLMRLTTADIPRLYRYVLAVECGAAGRFLFPLETTPAPGRRPDNPAKTSVVQCQM